MKKTKRKGGVIPDKTKRKGGVIPDYVQAGE